jgi:hypothetical protein
LLPAGQRRGFAGKKTIAGWQNGREKLESKARPSEKTNDGKV